MISQSHKLLLLPHLQGILADPSQQLFPPPDIFMYAFYYMQKEMREKRCLTSIKNPVFPAWKDRINFTRWKCL